MIYKPTLVDSPGVTLKETLEAMVMTQKDLSDRTGLTVKTISEIINGKNPITPETAIKLERVLGVSASFWNNLEKMYQEYLARVTAQKELSEEIRYLKMFECYTEIANQGWVSETKNELEKIENLLKFFGVDSLTYVLDIFKIQNIAFRKANNNHISLGALAAWLRHGEITAEMIQTKPFDKNALISSIPTLKQLSTLEPEEYSSKLRELCASLGVAVVYTPYLKNTFVNGATKWLSPTKALIQLSIRNRYEDIFWFSFFHELGHILLHGKKEQFIEFETDENHFESEADDFAKNNLISKEVYEEIENDAAITDNKIEIYAKNAKVSPGIIAGRLAHEGMRDWNRVSHLRRKLKLIPKT